MTTASVPRAWHRAVHSAPMAMLVVDLSTFSIVEVNGQARRLLRELDEAQEVEPTSGQLVLDRRHHEMLDLLASGRLEGFEGRLTGPSGDIRVWVRLLASPGDGSDRYALVAATDGAMESSPLDLPVSRPAVTVVGATDTEWLVAWVTREIGAVLGYRRKQFVGTPLLALAHPETAPDLVIALSHAAMDDGSAVVRAKLRHESGQYCDCQLVLAPRLGKERGVMFMISPAGDGASRGAAAPRHQVTKMVDHVHAVELARHGDLGAVDDNTVDGLSSRQWEIVTRLQQGERVPGIARAMYLSQSTVRNHLTAVFRKFGVHSQPELLAYLRARRGG